MAKRIRKLKEEMEDDEAMGQLPADKKTAYIEVCTRHTFADGRK